MPTTDRIDLQCMRRALQLAARGSGFVEPNPMVGCVVAHGAEVLGEGWHARFGGDHAERAAFTACSPPPGSTVYVTLEPCSHHGKTPPCVDLLIESKVRRVVAAMQDPNPLVSGNGFARLRQAGIQVDVGLLEAEALHLNAPYIKWITRQRPWVLAKWAMTLDGKIAARDGTSQWISGDASRRVVHELRGKVDAIVVGIGTVLHDNPRLTARPPGPRTPVRVVLDHQARLPDGSRLVTTADQVPTLLFTSVQVDPQRCRMLQDRGCEVIRMEQHGSEIDFVLSHLAQRQMSRVLVEGGSEVLGAFWDCRAVDEVHVFVAPSLLGGTGALSPMGGTGFAPMQDAARLKRCNVRVTGEDVYLSGRVDW